MAIVNPQFYESVVCTVWNDDDVSKQGQQIVFRSMIPLARFAEYEQLITDLEFLIEILDYKES